MRKLLLAVALLGAAHVPALAEPAYVIVDPADGYATTYVALPKSLNEEQLAAIKARAAERRGAYVERWSAVVADLHKHVGAFIKKNEYPEVKTAEGLLAFLQKFEGVPIGLTWNGGLAITHNDYRYARGTHERHLADPAYVARVPDRQIDPVHPDNHLGPVLAR